MSEEKILIQIDDVVREATPEEAEAIRQAQAESVSLDPSE